MGIAVYEYIDTNTTYWGLPELNGLPLGEKVLAAWRVTYSRAASNAPVAAVRYLARLLWHREVNASTHPVTILIAGDFLAVCASSAASQRELRGQAT